MRGVRIQAEAIIPLQRYCSVHENICRKVVQPLCERQSCLPHILNTVCLDHSDSEKDRSRDRKETDEKCESKKTNE